jgi:uncharacterized membrane protein YjgN (DUF898 family)
VPIPITCGNCGVTLRAPDNAAGRKVKCAKCGEGIIVPAGAPVLAAAPAARAPAGRPRPARPAVPDYQTSVRAGQVPSEGERFTFDGGAGDFLVTAILAYLLMIVTFAIGTPWAVCMIERWRAGHTLIGGRRLRFVGTGGQLFVKLLVLYLLSAVTFGLYMLWGIPGIMRWMVENTEFDEG